MNSSSPIAAPHPASPTPAFNDQFEVLRRAYGERLEEKIDGIEAGWQHFLGLGAGAEKSESLSNQHRITHSLAGSGATFGFPLVSQCARRAEVALKAVMGQGGTPTPEQRVEIEAAYAALRAVVQRQHSEGAPVGCAGGSGALDGASAVSAQFFQGDEAQSETLELGSNALVYLFCEDPDQVPAWVSSVETFGYRVGVWSDAHELQSAAAREKPAAIIINSRSEPMLVGDRGEPLGSVLHRIEASGDSPIPLIWTCEIGDLRARLQAVRLGAAAFFTHPVDLDALLVKLDDLTAQHTPEPFRVLIVDDEPALARLYSLMLRQAGMETREVTNPLEVMAPIVDFRPDLILMDVYMPGCNGTEIAAVIRQQEAYVGIPIMFLSSESDVTKQLEAMRQGGDDFLLKPVQPRYLVSSVLTRATRARVLQNLMVRDSLTGLLNHTKTKEQLSIEIERVRRLGHEISLAMIDIDHFKKVNDSYGHATGDRVLRSLSRLLSQRMRQTDVVGRYGGEEFAVIMIGANAENARNAIEKVRQSWAKLPHYSNGREFYSTFSAGVASAPPHATAATLSEAADAALYQAKGAGRDCVVLADGAQ